MAYFTRLPNGDWGVRGIIQEIIPGTRIPVTKRDGTSTTVIVGDIISNDTANNLVTANVAKSHQTPRLQSNGYHPPIQPPPVSGPLAAPTPPTETPKPIPLPVPTPISPERCQQLGKVMMLQYDIPQKCDFPNPSGILRRLGIRVTLSVWAIQDGRIPWNLLDEMTSSGVTWHLVQFAESESGKLIALAETALCQEADKAKKSLEDSILAGQKKLEEMQSDPSVTARQLEAERTRFENNTRAFIKRTDKLIKDLSEAAKAFGVVDSVSKPFSKIRSTVDSLQSIAHSRAALYSYMTEQAKGTDMEVASEESDVPAGVLADYLEDEKGIDMNSVRSVFQD